jgi:hypothetical protein
METTNNKLTEEQEIFIREISSYLDTKFYYFGSVQRPDYLPGKSDIDIDIFTENEASTIAKLVHFLHADKKDVKQTVTRIGRNNKILTGNKLKYKNKFIQLEFSIYNEKFKNAVLNENNSKVILPFYCTWLLNALKVFYYQLHILPLSSYVFLKRHILAVGNGLKNEGQFVVL